MNRIGAIRRNERGATAIEYAIIAGLIGLGLVGSLVTTRGSLSAVFGTASSQMGSGTAEAPVLKLNAALARASFWSAKTLSGAPTLRISGMYKTYEAQFTDGSSILMTYNFFGSDYDITTFDADSLYSIRVKADGSGFPGVASMSYLTGNPGPDIKVTKNYYGDNRQIYSADGYDKGYPLFQTTTTYNTDGSVSSQNNGSITADFRTAIQASQADAILFKDATK